MGPASRTAAHRAHQLPSVAGGVLRTLVARAAIGARAVSAAGATAAVGATAGARAAGVLPDGQLHRAFRVHALAGGHRLGDHYVAQVRVGHAGPGELDVPVEPGALERLAGVVGGQVAHVGHLDLV